ncbi:hypothetical protein A2U01_0053763, partial [Trifolium medium]|nr:hypothetical protein [Trifolium medium]
DHQLVLRADLCYMLTNPHSEVFASRLMDVKGHKEQELN